MPQDVESRPRISVCIPTFNHAHFLKDAIDSVLAQTFADLELVVVDNCSTDDTTRVVGEYAARDPRVRYVRNPANLGAQRNLNRCIEVASGEYVNVLCADDMLEPTALEELARLLDGNPGASLAGCARMAVDAALRPVSVLSFSGRSELVPGNEAITRCLITGNRIGEPSAVLFRKEDAARGFDTRYRQLIDLEMWFHLLRKGSFAFVPGLLCRVRRHDDSLTSENLKSVSYVADFQMILDDYVSGGKLGGRVLRCCWMMQGALRTWALQYTGLPIVEAHRIMRKFCSLAIFYLLLPAEALLKGSIIVRGRLAARRLRRARA